ncbi:MAG: hypothetical protein LUP99_03915 [Methanomicrobiales archaeon]|nr:hypothetical protein [Methanomicrobiales archaeon]
MRHGASGARERTDSENELYRKITLTDEMKQYLATQACDFRVCTSCGGPILLPVTIKRPKPTDITLRVGDRILYISRYQAPFLSSIDREMIPRYVRRYDR